MILAALMTKLRLPLRTKCNKPNSILVTPYPSSVDVFPITKDRRNHTALSSSNPRPSDMPSPAVLARYLVAFMITPFSHDTVNTALYKQSSCIPPYSGSNPPLLGHSSEIPDYATRYTPLFEQGSFVPLHQSRNVDLYASREAAPFGKSSSNVFVYASRDTSLYEPGSNIPLHASKNAGLYASRDPSLHTQRGDAPLDHDGRNSVDLEL